MRKVELSQVFMEWVENSSPLLAILYLIDKCKCDEIDASLHEYTEDLHTIWLNYLRKTTPKVFKT